MILCRPQFVHTANGPFHKPTNAFALPACYRAVQPEFMAGETTLNGNRHNPSPSRTHHYETLHFSPDWKLEMSKRPPARATHVRRRVFRVKQHALYILIISRTLTARLRLPLAGIEQKLGVVPVNWTTSSAMNDPRPNGRSIFDARHKMSPVGRMRGSGYKEMSDDRGVSAASPVPLPLPLPIPVW